VTLSRTGSPQITEDRQDWGLKRTTAGTAVTPSRAGSAHLSEDRKDWGPKKNGNWRLPTARTSFKFSDSFSETFRTHESGPGLAGNEPGNESGRGREKPGHPKGSIGSVSYRICFMAATETIGELLEAGVHFGHQTKRWNPKMKRHILEKRNSIYIINLEDTIRQIDRATEFLRGVAARGGRILFVGCKKQAQDAVKEAALACGQFYVNQRWLGGTLTNLTTIRKSVARLNYIEAIEKSPQTSSMTKRELASLTREAERLRRNLDGIRDMEKHPDAVVVIDVNEEAIAVAETRRLNIPTVAVVDTNSNPDLVAYPIAGNDDAIRSIRTILRSLVDAVVSGSGGVVANEQADLSAVSE
jgi:small subunit ribosomal protein S2